MKPSIFQFPVPEFRSLPFPIEMNSKGRAKIATCFVALKDLPEGLIDWMEVNPRRPSKNKSNQLTGNVAKAIIDTLQDEPDKFALKNQGIYLLARKVEATRSEGGKTQVSVEFDDGDLHGVVNGGHTYTAIMQVRGDKAEAGELDDWTGYVRLHIMEGIDEDDIDELAEGLNRSLQVDDPSLENLRGTFAGIQAAMKGKKGEDKIAYSQGHPGEFDILQLLTYLTMFNLKEFPDRKSFPNKIFGHPKAVLGMFTRDMEEIKGEKNFQAIIPHTHEILRLAEEIENATAPYLGKLKTGKKQKDQARIRSSKNKDRVALFKDGKIAGRLPHGLLYPMLAAFRANLKQESWESGILEWKRPWAELLPKVAEEIARIVLQEYHDQNSNFADVGKKESAYRGCYQVVLMELTETA